MFMVRCKIPGGRLTADQYLSLDELAGTHANGTLRFTSRQGIQFHGVLKDSLRDTIAGINATLLTTLGACGDVNRNVMCCPAPLQDGVREQMQATATALADHLAPKSRAYHEIWLDGKPAADPNAPAEPEPIYGKVYLPRKFKIGIALPEDNCIDVYAQDLGLLSIVENGAVAGYNLLIGGGMGMTHGKAETFPYIGKPICYVPYSQAVPSAEAVVKLFRDHGNRADRKRARIKYLVHDWGVDKFREVLASYLPEPLVLPKEVDVKAVDLHLGWHPQGDGKWFFGLSVENGRIKDDGERRLRIGLRTLIERMKPALRLTASQDILLCDLEQSALPFIETMLNHHGIPLPGKISAARSFHWPVPRSRPAAWPSRKPSARCRRSLMNWKAPCARKASATNRSASA